MLLLIVLVNISSKVLYFGVMRKAKKYDFLDIKLPGSSTLWGPNTMCIRDIHQLSQLTSSSRSSRLFKCYQMLMFKIIFTDEHHLWDFEA